MNQNTFYQRSVYQSPLHTTLEKTKRLFLDHGVDALILILLAYLAFGKEIDFNFQLNEPQSATSAGLKSKSTGLNAAKKMVAASIGDALFSAPAISTEVPVNESYVTELSAKALTSAPAIPNLAPAKTNISFKNFAKTGNITFLLEPELAVQADPAVVKGKKDKCWDYVTRFVNVAKLEREKFGVPVSVTLAQGILESDAGDSRLTQRSNNHFGVKTFNKHNRNYVVAHDDTPRDHFQLYDNAWQSYRAHSLLLLQERYKPLQYLSKKDYVGWTKGLQKAGYATDPHYADKLVKIINGLELYRFDEI